MKKILVIALAAILVVSAVCVLAACGEEQKVTGSVDYTSWSTNYGTKVDVVVKGGVIKSVTLYDDEQTNWVRTSTGWTEGQHPGDLGFTKAEAAYEKWINDNLVGQKVDTVLGWDVTVTADEQTVDKESVPHITGATQSSARIIKAVQNALSQLDK